MRICLKLIYLIELRCFSTHGSKATPYCSDAFILSLKLGPQLLGLAGGVECIIAFPCSLKIPCREDFRSLQVSSDISAYPSFVSSSRLLWILRGPKPRGKRAIN